MSLVPFGEQGCADADTMRLVRDWKQAKLSKDYRLADQLRDELKSRGAMKVAEKALLERPGDWLCPKCGDVCFASRSTCRRCNAEKPVPTEELIERWRQAKRGRDYAEADRIRAELNERGEQVDDAVAFGRPGDWKCPECGCLCFASKDRCFKCGASKAGAAPAAPGSGAGLHAGVARARDGGGGAYSQASFARRDGGDYGMRHDRDRDRDRERDYDRGRGRSRDRERGRDRDIPRLSGPGDRLPPGWEEHLDEHYNRSYWHNARTGETTWHRPTR